MNLKCQVIEAESKYFTPVNSGNDKIDEIKYCTRYEITRENMTIMKRTENYLEFREDGIHQEISRIIE